MKRILLVIGFLTCLAITTHAQDTDTTIIRRHLVQLDKELSLLTGYNLWRYHFLEIGLAVNRHGVVGHHPSALAYFISSEVKIDDQLLIGPKIGIWAGGGVAGMALGLNLIYYTDFDNGTLRLRPEVGMGFDRFKVVYGYNIGLIKKDFDPINTNNISLVILFNLRTLKTIQHD